MKTSLALAVALVGALPGVAIAQPPARPVAELGVQVSKRIGNEAPTWWTGRLTLNLTPLTAVEGTADIQKTFTNEFEPGTRTSTRVFSGHWRQTLFTSRRLQVFGVLGAGTNRVEQFFPQLDSVFVDTEFVAHLGPGVQVEVAPWLALRGDIRLSVGDNAGGLRGMIGGAIPIGRFRAGSRPAGSAPPVAEWRRVKPGREVWITTDSGSRLHGEVAVISNSTITLLRRDGEVTIRLDEVRLVEARDSLRNGFLIGGAAGTLGGGLLFGWAASTFCESESCDGVEVVAVLLGAASGLAVGGLLGAMVDGIIPGRQSLFERNAIRVTPVITSTGKSVNIAIDWR